MTEEGRETVLITGASSGIGESLAWVFAEHGHDLILVARSADKLDHLADQLAGEHNVMVSVRPVDLSEPGSAESLSRVLQRDGQVVDILTRLLLQGMEYLSAVERWLLTRVGARCRAIRPLR